VTYTYSAGASLNGLALASLPAGTIQFYADDGLVCTKTVGAEVVSGTCVVTFGGFGGQGVYATYNTGGVSYNSAVLGDNIQPYATTTQAVISGGGSLGGLTIQADVTDSNGNAVTVGSASLTVTDVKQGWSYAVAGALGEAGADQSAFACTFIENAPRVGEYSGCGFDGLIVVTPGDGDTITLSATYTGTADWTGSQAGAIGYSFP